MSAKGSGVAQEKYVNGLTEWKPHSSRSKHDAGSVSGSTSRHQLSALFSDKHSHIPACRMIVANTNRG